MQSRLPVMSRQPFHARGRQSKPFHLRPQAAPIAEGPEHIAAILACVLDRIAAQYEDAPIIPAETFQPVKLPGWRERWDDDVKAAYLEWAKDREAVWGHA